MNSSPLNSLTSAAIYCSSNLHTHLQSICHIFSYNLRFTYSMLFLYSIIYFILVFPIIFRQSVLSWLIIFYTFFYSLSSGHSIHQKIGRRLIFRHSQYIYLYSYTLCQSCQHSCHFQIVQHLHKCLCIYSIRHFDFLLSCVWPLHIRIQIFFLIKCILDQLCIFLTVFIQDMSILVLEYK